MPGHQRARFDLAVGDQRADAQAIADPRDAAQRVQRGEVDQQRRFGQAHRQRRHQRLPPGEQPGVVAVLLQQAQHLLDGRRLDVVEGSSFHGELLSSDAIQTPNPVDRAPSTNQSTRTPSPVAAGAWACGARTTRGTTVGAVGGAWSATADGA